MATTKQLDDLQSALKRIEDELVILRTSKETEQKRKDGEKEPIAATKQLENLQAALKRIEDELIIPRIPKETEQKLKDIENVLNDSKQWPQDSNEAEQLRQSFDEIVQEIPRLAAESILPELARLHWGVEALWNLRTHAHATPSQLEEVRTTIAEIMERHPQGHFEEIQLELENRLEQIDPQLRDFQIEQLLVRAELALEDKEDASAVFSSLTEFQADNKVATILSKLRSKALEKSGLERLQSFEKNLSKTHSFVDDRARQISLLTIQEGILHLRVDLEFEDAVSQEVVKKAETLLNQCDKELQALADKQEDNNAKNARSYQKWALEQIRYFDSPGGWYYDMTLSRVVLDLKNFRDAEKDEDWVAFRVFPSLKALVQEKSGVDLSSMQGAMLTAIKRKEIYQATWATIGWKNSIDAEIAYRTTRDGMVKFLLPIQPHLLDPPVAQLYQQAFSKGWQKLEGREDQLFVAQQSAVVQKKTLKDVVSLNP